MSVEYIPAPLTEHEIQTLGADASLKGAIISCSQTGKCVSCGACCTFSSTVGFDVPDPQNLEYSPGFLGRQIITVGNQTPCPHLVVCEDTKAKVCRINDYKSCDPRLKTCVSWDPKSPDSIEGLCLFVAQYTCFPKSLETVRMIDEDYIEPGIFCGLEAKIQSYIHRLLSTRLDDFLTIYLERLQTYPRRLFEYLDFKAILSQIPDFELSLKAFCDSPVYSEFKELV